MNNWIYVLVLILILSLFINTNRKEHFFDFIREAIRTNQDFNDMIFRNVNNYNNVAKDWIPNVSWIYTIKDKGIEKTRAERGLPPLMPTQPNVKMDLSNSMNRLSFGFKP